MPVCKIVQQTARFVCLFAMALAAGCTVTPVRPIPGDSEVTVGESYIDLIYEERSWISPFGQFEDPLERGTDTIPFLSVRTKILGVDADAARRSLALKIAMIESARHTVDFAYYIFKRDRVGYALIAALCNAVKRGVDVRMVVDSIGSIHMTHSELKALQTCAEEAGFMKTADGESSARRARVQIVVFNSLSNLSGRLRSMVRKIVNAFRSPDSQKVAPVRVWTNRRMHDKLLLIDGEFPDKAVMVVGGRNMSVAYYGIDGRGKPDPSAYIDMEIVVRPPTDAAKSELHVGQIAWYFQQIFRHFGNKRLISSEYAQEQYDFELRQAVRDLGAIKSSAVFAPYFSTMDEYLETGWEPTDARFTHELKNLTDRQVWTRAVERLKQSPNSIMNVLREMPEGKINRIVSPYLFFALYRDVEGNVTLDEIGELKEWLHQNPGYRLEIVTNSVLTSDNALAQSIIDMEMAPALILTPELLQAWLSGLEKGELDGALVTSPEWQKQINDSQIYVYQTGKLDSHLLVENGTVYGKLHAKFLAGPRAGFVGTSNFDYRSRLLNSEIGFFTVGEHPSAELNAEFDKLLKISYRWGTPEWLEMRRNLLNAKGSKGGMVRRQREIYKLIKALHLEWMI